MKTKKAICPKCKRVVALRKDGSCRDHNSTPLFGEYCPGSSPQLRGIKKCEVETCTQEAKYRLTIRQGGSMDLCGKDCESIRAQMIGPTHTDYLRWIED